MSGPNRRKSCADAEPAEPTAAVAAYAAALSAAAAAALVEAPGLPALAKSATAYEKIIRSRPGGEPYWLLIAERRTAGNLRNNSVHCGPSVLPNCGERT